LSAVALCGILWATEWRVPVRFRPTSLDTEYYYTYYFGEREGATDNYDPFIDVGLPMAPPEGFFPYFVGDTASDPPMPYLREDYRAPAEPGVGHISYIWQLSFMDSPGESVWVIWDADSFPYTPEYPIYMHFLVAYDVPEDADWESSVPITEVGSVYVAVEQSVFFRYWDRTGISETPARRKIRLDIYPQPFVENCNIVVKLAGAFGGDYKFPGEIVDLSGRVVKNFVVPAGEQFVWNPDDLPGGVYFVRVRLPQGEKLEKKVIYLK